MGGGPGGGPSGPSPGTEGNLGISPGTAGNAGISATGADVGVSTGPTGGVPSASSTPTSPATINAALTPVPVIGAANAALASAGLPSLGDLAQGDPAIGGGVSSAEGGVATGGGPPDFTTPEKKKQRTIAQTQDLTTPTTLDDIFESPPPVIDISKRRRFGRQQTILTGDLGEAPVARPTLLGQ